MVCLIVAISFMLAYWLAHDESKNVVAIEANEDVEPECAQQAEPEEDMVWLEGGKFSMGSSDFYPEEGPIKDIEVEGFWIDKYEVTNAQFEQFVDATGYITVAEQQLNPADFPGIPADQLKPGSVVF
ncbi:MAG: sulfatase modifying factor 1, partial [Gammaproteobacteria bacterium]